MSIKHTPTKGTINRNAAAMAMVVLCIMLSSCARAPLPVVAPTNSTQAEAKPVESKPIKFYGIVDYVLNGHTFVVRTEDGSKKTIKLEQCISLTRPEDTLQTYTRALKTYLDTAGVLRLTCCPTQLPDGSLSCSAVDMNGRDVATVMLFLGVAHMPTEDDGPSPCSLISNEQMFVLRQAQYSALVARRGLWGALAKEAERRGEPMPVGRPSPYQPPAVQELEEAIRGNSPRR